MSRRQNYEDLIYTNLSIEQKQKSIDIMKDELRESKNNINAYKMYQKGFWVGIAFATVSMLIILGVVYLGTHYVWGINL